MTSTAGDSSQHSPRFPGGTRRTPRGYVNVSSAKLKMFCELQQKKLTGRCSNPKRFIKPRSCIRKSHQAGGGVFSQVLGQDATSSLPPNKMQYKKAGTLFSRSRKKSSGCKLNVKGRGDGSGERGLRVTCSRHVSEWETVAAGRGPGQAPQGQFGPKNIPIENDRTVVWKCFDWTHCVNTAQSR